MGMDKVNKKRRNSQRLFGLTKCKKRAIIIKLSDESERTAETAEYWEKRDFKIIIKLFLGEFKLVFKKF